MKSAFPILGLLVATCSTAAVAADLPTRRAPPPPPPPAVFTWTGFYIGGNAGYAFDRRDDVATFDDALNANAVGITRPGFAQLKQNGFSGGGQIGYNYEIGDYLHLGAPGSGVVIGVEADAAYTDLSSTTDVVVGGADNFLHSRLEFLGTVRGRLGYAFDRAMVYATGGFAYGETRDRADFFTGAAPAYSGARSGLSTGYVFGGGVEYALPVTTFLNVFNSSAVTAKIEFIHYDLGTKTFGVPTTGLAGLGTYTQTARSDGNIVRAGLNFKFGSPVVAPVVARY